MRSGQAVRRSLFVARLICLGAIPWLGVALGFDWLGAAGASWAAEPSPAPTHRAPSAQLAADASAEPAAQPIPEPAAQPASEPMAGPNDEPAAERIRRLIDRLGDADYHAREAAQAELAKLGFEAFDALSAATRSDDFEVAARARRLLRDLRIEWTAKDDPPDVRKALADYDSLSAGARIGRAQWLIELPDRRGLPAVCRVIRYERSALVGKHVALGLLRRLGSEPPDDETRRLLARLLSASSAPGARWVLAWSRSASSAEALAREWTALVDAEQNTLATSPNDSSPELVAGLLRLQVRWFKRLGAADEAAAAIGRLVEIEGGDPRLLDELVDWLLNEKAFGRIEQLAADSPERFDREPVLLYALAQAQAASGRPEEARKTADRAAALAAEPTGENLLAHLRAAYRLRQRGMFDWAEREYRHVIAGAPTPNFAAAARFALAEMLHDQGRNQQAASTLAEALEILERAPLETDVAGRSVEEIRARMHYFLARHHAETGEPARQREELDKALENDPADPDALIAAYQLSRGDAEYRQQVLRLVREAAAELQQFIDNEPEEPIFYNQYAWLVGNTEGDLDKALEYSRKSIALRPEEGGYYDTLAHVHFARGDYEEAVRAQTRAAELEPHSGLILGKLKFFQEQLERKRQSAPR